jgi:hypothetical protein
MATVTTSTNANPILYPGHTRIDYGVGDGSLWVLVLNSSGNIELSKSVNNGGSWAVVSTLVRANLQDVTMYVPTAGSVHVTYRTNESSQDRVYWRRFDLALLTWSSEILLASTSNGGVAGAVYTGLDVVAVGASGQEYVAVAIGTVAGANHGITLKGVFRSAAGVPSLSAGMFSGPVLYLQPGSGRIGPTLDIEHVGNGKSATAPHLWVTFGRSRINVFKAGWTGYGWTTPQSSYIMLSSVPAQNSIRGSFDGRRHITASVNPTSTSSVCVYERPRSHTGTTVTRTTSAHTAGVVRSCSVSYDYASDGMRVYAVGTSNNDLYYTTFNRTAGTWSAWTVVTTSDVLGSTPENYSVRRNAYGNARFDVVIAHTGAPNTIVHYPVTQAYNPNQPTWAIQGGIAKSTAAALLLDWNFSDVDPADVQTAYAVSRQIGVGVLAYWRASDSTWQATEQKNLSATTQISLASGWAAPSDANYSYAVKVWDSTDLPSIYSPPIVFIPSTVFTPTYVAPAPAAVITGDTLTVTWTVGEQSAWRIHLYQGAVQVWASGFVSGTVTTYEVPYALADGTAYTVGLTTKNHEGLDSAEIYQGFTTNFEEPAVPTFAFTPSTSGGYIRVVITNPTPAGPQPAVLSQDLYRRPTVAQTPEIRVAAGLASGATYDDWTAASGIDYQYRAHVRGVNGASVYSAWTA